MVWPLLRDRREGTCVSFPYVLRHTAIISIANVEMGNGEGGGRKKGSWHQRTPAVLSLQLVGLGVTFLPWSCGGLFPFADRRVWLIVGSHAAIHIRGFNLTLFVFFKIRLGREEQSGGRHGRGGGY